MTDRVVHVAGPARLSRDLDRLRIERKNEDPAFVAIEDLAVVLVDGPGVEVTSDLLGALAESCVAFVVPDSKRLPAGVLLPLSGHSLHAKTLAQQATASEPKKKQIWRQIVGEKIVSQAELLEDRGVAAREVRAVRSLASLIRSGDPDNLEGAAARAYWPALFGGEFRRDPDEPGLNSMLNYGYAVLRACVARALVGAGLHPALGVFHRGPANPFNLADDAIEPLRTLVDALVAEYVDAEGVPEELTPSIKRYLAQVTVSPVILAGSSFMLLPALERYAASLREALCGSARKVTVPSRPSQARSG